MGAFIARAHVDATWHARLHGSATQTGASACMALRWHILYIYYIGYSTYKRSIEELANPLNRVTSYTQHISLILSVWDYL